MKLLMKKLYGRFDYELEFKEGGITILTGPNGFGKSTILRCIEAFANSDILFFTKLDFEEMILVSDLGDSVVIKKDETRILINNHSYPYRKGIRRLSHRIIRSMETRLVNEGINREQEEQDLQAMAQVAGSIKMIKEQRLIGDRAETRIVDRGQHFIKRYENKIDEIPLKLYRYIARVASSYSEVATKLDSSFPYRLLNANDTDVIDAQKFSELYDEMNKKMEILTQNGISMINSQGELKFKKEDAKVLKIFFDDFSEKYHVYDSLMGKLSLFRHVVNKRLKFKKIYLSEDRELIVIDDASGKTIPLSCLSSGEQEIIVLFYLLIFEVKKGTLILIDEPEISLHIEWQMMFISDLKKIVEMNDLHAIVATHSADIIGGHRDIQIDLGELYQNGQHQTSTEQ